MMIRKIEALVLAFATIGAMSAAASAAQASEGHITTSASSASLLGERTGHHVFLTESGSVTCNDVQFEGTATDQGQSSDQLTFQELTLTARYTRCIAFGQAAVIDMNGCKYTITNKSGPGITANKTGYVDITGCTTGKVIEITPQLNCTITVPEQHNLGTLTFSNTPWEPSFHEVDANAFIISITYEGHGECPNLPSTKLRHSGSYSGGSSFLAHKDEGSIQVTHNGHQYEKLVQFFIRSIEVT